MGTASLVFGLIAIGFGLLTILLPIMALTSSEPLFGLFYFGLILTIVLFLIGGFLLRKYDNDKKKEKAQNS